MTIRDGGPDPLSAVTGSGPSAAAGSRPRSSAVGPGPTTGTGSASPWAGTGTGTEAGTRPEAGRTSVSGSGPSPDPGPCQGDPGSSPGPCPEDQGKSFGPFQEDLGLSLGPCPEEAWAAEDDLAVEQALALVRGEAAGEPHASGRPAPTGGGSSAGSRASADRASSADRGSSADRASSADRGSSAERGPAGDRGPSSGRRPSAGRASVDRDSADCRAAADVSAGWPDPVSDTQWPAAGWSDSDPDSDPDLAPDPAAGGQEGAAGRAGAASGRAHEPRDSVSSPPPSGSSPFPPSPAPALAPAPSGSGSEGGSARSRGRERRGRAVPWQEARALAARSGRRTPVRDRRLPLDQALGRVLAEPLTALTDLPPFDTSAMDGWVVSGPGPWTIRGLAETGRGTEPGILAGRGAPARLSDGEAVRIATGARIPADANAVIRSEHGRVDVAKGLLHAGGRVHPGQDIRPRGQECRSGDRLLPAGAVVTPAVLGLAAAAGYDELVTVARPRVDVLVLGDELLTGGLPHDGLIRDALGPMIGPWLRALGADVSAARRLGDDAGALRRALAGSDADLVITTGGTAFGPVDHVHPVLFELGAELSVDGVAVRPGHPMLLARLGAGDPEPGPYVVGLPGNPLAAVSGLLTLAQPLLRGLAGHAAREPRWAVIRDEVRGHPHDTRLVPVARRPAASGERSATSRERSAVLRERPGTPGAGGSGTGRPGASGPGAGGAGTGSAVEYVVPLRYDGPAMLRGIAVADGLAVVPPGGVRSGTEVEILELPWASATPWTEGCFT